MKKELLTTLCLAFATQSPLFAQEDAPKWMRWSAISPDGKNIAFSAYGDIYLVPVSGGKAQAITSNTAYDYAPVWSPDSKHIAFASAREGSLDVYISSLEGGSPKRLTTHSGKEVPVAFLDNEHVLFSTFQTPTTENIQFPSSLFSQLYQVSITGGRPKRFSDWTLSNPSIGQKGILFDDIKGYEDNWRKHHTSSMARDIWWFDGSTYKKMTDFKGEDRNAVWNSDESGYYYLSEQDGTFNVYYRSLDNQENKQLTFYKDNPVRFLSASDNGKLCYSYGGELYTLTPGQEPTKVKVEIIRDDMQREIIRNLRTSGASEVSVSPENKEIAFIMGGDVYVTSIDYKTTRQITDTPERERTVDFAPDGRSLVYASERNGKWQIYQTSLTNKDDKNFTYAKEWKEERLTDGTYTAFQPQYNPQGKEVAFLKNRTEICVLNLKSKKVHTAMDGKYQYSYVDGDQDYSWSPDGNWILTEYIGVGGWNNKDIALVKADGSGEIHNLTNSGYSEGSPQWVLDGKAMIFQSDRAGYRSHGSWGAESDAYIMFFDQEAYDRFRMSKEEIALADEDGKKKQKEDDSDKKDKEKEKEKKIKDLKFDLSDLEYRTIRLTPYSTNLGSTVLSKDGTKLYYIAPHAGSPALWMQDLKEYRNELKMPGIGWGSLDVDEDIKYAYLASGGAIQKLDIENGRLSAIAFEAFYTDRPQELRAYLFDHIWNQTKEKLYDPNMNGADWDKLYTTYSAYLPYINNNYDFAEMASEMLGELNVSHTGCRFGGTGSTLATASLGVFFDETYEGDGLKIKEIMKGSPLETSKKEIEPGHIIKAIDGQEIKAGQDYYPLLDGKAGRYTRLTISKKGKEFDITIKPISQGTENGLLYKRWIERNRQIVDKLSNNRIAYVHIKAMDAASFQTLYKELMGDENRNKEAVIVDTRHNGGGWLHGDICVLLSGKRVMQFKPRGQFIGNDPFDRWVKPSCMLVCEDNYSNAHGTPWYYKELGLGQLIGAPVPGTMTAVWWEGLEGGMVFGIPQVGAYDNNGEVLENQELKPDIEIYNNPADVLTGKDSQLERAVQEILKTVSQQ